MHFALHEKIRIQLYTMYFHTEHHMQLNGNEK